MGQEKRKITVLVDSYTRVCLTAIAVLLTVLIIGLWADGVRTVDDAQAAEKFLDTGAQRQEMLKAQQEVNTKLDNLMELLKSGEAKVQVVAGAGKVATEGGSDVTAPARQK
ncbi:MAG: hypothetical protein KAU28_05590 [Phycisphaerae bacterium]|nr:hypothetical protein [Phycisphaerae bacterium]